MMLSGCTELAGDSTESGEFTNQDLEGIYMAAGFGLYVEMNADDTSVVSALNIEDCYDTEGSDDICNGPCDLKVKILDMTSNSLIYESSIIYVS